MAGRIIIVLRCRIITFVGLAGRVVGKRSGALLAVCVLTVTAAGCSGRAVSASAQTPDPAHSTVRSFASPDPTSTPTPGAAAGPPPLPVSTVRQLPDGAFYLLAGRDLGSLNVWEITPDGRERLLTRCHRGSGIDGFAASRAGIVLAEASGGADNLARLTSHGPAWLRPDGDGGALLRGSSPDIRGNGTIGYVTPPGNAGRHGAPADFAIWIRRSFTGPAGMLLRQRRALDGPVFGPDDGVAVEGWVGQPGKRQPGIIIYGHGRVRRLSIGVPAIPSLVAWGEHAPALALAFPANDAELLFPDGQRQPLPAGWQPLAWNPGGSELLMQSATALGIWSRSAPGQVTRIGRISPGAQILQAAWLDRKAPLGS
ncbi:MAG: hypothetical protein ACHP9Z_10810 [Streptosporangiales bacterium]